MDTKNNTGIGNNGNWNSGNWNSGNRNSGNRNSGDGNSGDRNSGYRNSGNWNSGDRNSGNWNSGDRNSGYGNSTNMEAGIFNSSDGKVRMFNKLTDLTWNQIAHPHFSEFYLTKWISESQMTDQEKNESPEFHVRDGYLKKFEYKEAWANFWRDTDEDNRKRFLALPNFCPEIFKDITGIDVAIDVKKAEKKAEILKKIEELRKEADRL